MSASTATSWVPRVDLRPGERCPYCGWLNAPSRRGGPALSIGAVLIGVLHRGGACPVELQRRAAERNAAATANTATDVTTTDVSKTSMTSPPVGAR